jgi:hypothetical protein
MNAPLNILAALASYGVKAVIENGPCTSRVPQG